MNRIYDNIDNFGHLSEIYDKFGSGEDADNKVITYKDFMLSQNSTPDQQRVQIMNTNLRPMLMAYGGKARVYQYSLKLTADQKRVFKKLYDSLPVHVLVKYKIPMWIMHGTDIIQGVWLKMNYQKEARNDNLVPASFQFFIIDEEDTSGVGVDIRGVR